MHGTEDDSVLDGPQQFFVGFQKRGETVEISRGHLEGLRIRSISPAPDTVAGFAMALIQAFPRMVSDGYSCAWTNEWNASPINPATTMTWTMVGIRSRWIGRMKTSWQHLENP